MNRIRLSLFDAVFALWAVVVPVALGQRLLSTDGDVARHIRLGEWMLAHGAMLSRDVFSHTKAGEPLLAFEWGSEVVLAAAHRVGGLAAVAVLAGLVIALTYSALLRVLLSRGVDPLAAYATTMGAAILGGSHWVARPHLATMLLVVVLLGRLERPDGRSPWWYLPLFALWANLHGGFVFGLMLVGAYAAGAGLEAAVGRDGAWRDRARHYALAFALAALGSLINPHGVGLWAHVAQFFGQRFLQEATQEFAPPDVRQLGGALFFATAAAIAAAVVRTRRRPPLPHLLVAVMALAFALRAQRNVALFGLTALPLMALHIDADRRRRRAGRPQGPKVDPAMAARPGAASGLAAAGMIALGLGGGRIGNAQVVSGVFDASVFPVHAVDSMRAATLKGKLIHEFTWGGYLLYAWPEQRVFIDGGTDHYGPALLAEYLGLLRLAARSEEGLRRRDVSIALLRPESPLAQALAESGWPTWYRDSVAVVLRRPDSASASR